MDTSSRQSWIRNNPKTTLVLLILVLTLVLDLTFTGIYHLIKYGTIHKYAERKAMGVESSVFHHTLKPSKEHGYQRWGNTTHAIATNSLGFKDAAVREVPLSTDKDRVLFIGDSFTQGVGFAYGKTFVGLIDAALADRNVEVLNAAVASYSPAIYFKKTEHVIEEVGLQINHLVVFLDISDIQDEAQMYDIRNGKVVWIAGGAPALKNFFYEYTTIPRNIWHTTAKLHAKLTDEPGSRRTDEETSYGTNNYRSRWTIDKPAYADYGKVGLQKAKKHMDLLQGLLEQHQIGMTLVVYPWPDQILHQDLDSIQVTFWQGWAAERSVRFVNLFADFIQTGAPPKDVIRKYFIPGDVHWNEEGHRLIAERFLARWEYPPDKDSPLAAPGSVVID